MSAVVRNVGWAFASSIVNVAVNLVAVPFYLRFLGTEAYGLIGFYTTLQVLSQILDFGLASTINREVARSASDAGRHQAADLLHTLAVACMGISLLIAATIFIAAPWIAGHWLTTSHVPLAVVTEAVMLMGFNLATRWPLGLYQGAINGAQRLALTSVVNIAANLGGSIATIAVITLFSRTIQAFFVVQAVFGLMQAIVLGVCAFRVVGSPGSRFRIETIVGIWRFSAGMGAIALTSLVFTQLDKVLLSKLVGLEQFGQYMLAVLVVGGLQMVVQPVFNTIYPRFSSLVAQDRLDQLAGDYAAGSRLAASMLFPLAATLVFHGVALVSLWTGNPALASHVAPLIAILAVGSACNGIMYFPYALQLAFGKPGIPLAINLGLLVIIAPLIVVLAMSRGVEGGAMSWAMVGLVYVAVGTWVTGHRVMRSAGWKWLLRDVGVPFLVSVPLVFAGELLTLNLRPGAWVETALAALFALLAAASCIGLDASSRRIAGRFIAAATRGAMALRFFGHRPKAGKA